MFLTETINFGVGTALFLHTLFKVVVNYACDTCGLSPRAGKSSDRRRVSPSVAQGHSCLLPENLPSIIDIKRTLPKSCFESSVSTSVYYLVKDIGQVAFNFLPQADSVMLSRMCKLRKWMSKSACIRRTYD